MGGVRNLQSDPINVSLRRNSAIATVLIIGAIAGLIAPMAYAAAVAEGPYEALGRMYPGSGISILTAGIQAVSGLSAIMTVGGLLWLVLAQAKGRNEPVIALGPIRNVLHVAASTWALVALPYGALNALDTSGVSLQVLSQPGGLAYLISSTYAPGALLIHMGGAITVFLIVQFARGWQWYVAGLWASAWAVIAPVAVGHVLVGPNHDFASDVAYIQALAKTGALGLVLVTATGMALGSYPRPAILRRLYPVTIVLLIAAILPEGLIAWVKLAGSALTESATGWLMLGQWLSAAIILIAIAAGAALARRGKVSARILGVVLVGASVGAFGWWSGYTTMLLEPPPQYFVPTSISQVFMGYDVPLPVSIETWLTQWRPNLLFLLLAVGAVGVYVTAVYRLHRRGDSWPVGRTISWSLGWAIAVLVTSSGLGKYSAPDFATHMIVHMTLNMLVPVFLVLGGVITLLLRASSGSQGPLAGVHNWITWMLNWRVIRMVYNPLFVFGFFIISYYGLYLSEMFGRLMPFHWGHQLMNLHFLIIGVMFYSLVIGVDPTPRQLPHIAKLGYLIAAMPFHAFFAIVLMTSKNIIGGDFYQRLDLPWSDLAASQYMGGSITWAGGELPLLIVVIVLGMQWAKQDARESRRKDRHFDSGLDQEFNAYNAMLEKLAAREAHALPTASTPEESHDEATQ